MWFGYFMLKVVSGISFYELGNNSYIIGVVLFTLFFTMRFIDASIITLNLCIAMFSAVIWL